jgi:hypothetical protein
MPCWQTVMTSPEFHATRQVSADTAVSVPPEKAWLAWGASTNGKLAVSGASHYGAAAIVSPDEEIAATARLCRRYPEKDPV